MDAHDHSPGFRWEVLKKIRRRNENERKRYEDIVYLTNSLYESLDMHVKENRRLIVINAHLESSANRHSSSDTSSSKAEDKIASDKNYVSIHDELADLQKQKAEYAQQVISLRSSLDAKEREMDAKGTEVLELKASLSSCEQQLKRTHQKLVEAEHNLQLVRDEYDALHLTSSCCEERKQRLERENADLIGRLIALKAKDADRLNAEAERFMRTRQAKLQKELEDAANEPVVIDTVSRNRSFCFDAIIPRKVKHKFEAGDSEVNAVCWSHADQTFATAGGDRKVKWWDILSGQPLLKGVASESNSAVCSLDLDAEETLLLASSWDYASRIWSVADMKIKHTLTGHCGKVMSAKFLGETGKVVSGSHDRTLKVWDLRRRACLRTILAVSSVNDVVTSDRSGSNIVSGHFDRKIRFWDTRADTPQTTHEIHLQGRITSLDLAADGYSLLSCVRDDSLKLIDFRMNNVIRTFSADGFLIGCDWTRAKLSPDGQWCVCGSQDGGVYIWNTATGALQKVLKEHTSNVICCAWSWCGNYLLSADKNKKAVLWSEF